MIMIFCMPVYQHSGNCRQEGSSPLHEIDSTEKTSKSGRLDLTKLPPTSRKANGSVA